MPRGRWQVHMEGGSPTFLRLERHLSLMSLDDFLDDGETKPGAAALAGVGLSACAKGVNMLAWNAWGIPLPWSSTLALPPRPGASPTAHDAILRRELHRIGYEVSSALG